MTPVEIILDLPDASRSTTSIFLERGCPHHQSPGVFSKFWQMMTSTDANDFRVDPRTPPSFITPAAKLHHFGIDIIRQSLLGTLGHESKYLEWQFVGIERFDFKVMDG